MDVTVGTVLWSKICPTLCSKVVKLNTDGTALVKIANAKEKVMIISLKYWEMK